MNEERLKQILNKIGQTDVPENIAEIAEQTSQGFIAALNLLQSQRTSWFTGFKRIAVAAGIVFAFAAGLTMGRWSKPVPSASPNIAAYASTSPVYLGAQTNNNGFWRQKALAAMQPRPYAQPTTTRISLLNAYKQYLKEKHND